jgi:hypothetical protein
MTAQEILQRAQTVDLMEIPKGMGERCSNCSFIDGTYCKHPEVQFDIALIKPTDELCCARWENPEANRELEVKETTMSRMAFDSDEQTETIKKAGQGEQGIAVETMSQDQNQGKPASPEGNPNPEGNPHDYLEEKNQTDGVPRDQPNEEHLNKDKIMTLLRQYGLDPIEAGMSLEGAFAKFRSQEEAQKCAGLFKEAGFGASSIQYHQEDQGYIVQTQDKETKMSTRLAYTVSRSKYKGFTIEIREKAAGTPGKPYQAVVEGTVVNSYPTFEEADQAAEEWVDEFISNHPEEMSKGNKMSEQVVNWEAEAAAVISQAKKRNMGIDEYMDNEGYSESEKREVKKAMKNVKLHGDANEQEPGIESGHLVGVVEHEGHSISIHKTSEGHVLKGKGSAGYISSEPIVDKEHAEEYAKELLSAHAKLKERDIVAKNTNLSEVDGERMGWEGVKPKEKKEMWESLTGGATHKITACMNKIDGHVDNPGAYCKSLADEVGYKPE